MSATLWIVDPSLHHAEEQGIGEILDGWPGGSQVFRPGLQPGDLPPRSVDADVSGVVVLGSAASVHDPLPWVSELGIWLGPWLRGERKTPLLGICFGHQLIAHAAGGRVDYLNPARTKRAGIETSDLEHGRLGGSGELRVVVSHREHVVAIPPRFRVTATRAAVPVDGLEHETLPIFSFQFHPEAREEFASRSGIDPALIDERVRSDSRRLLAAFRQRALRRAN